MLKILFLLAVMHNVENLRTCRWVCIDDKNNIKKEYVNSKKFSLNIQNKHEITLPTEDQIAKSVKKKVVLLKNPDLFIEPTQDLCKAKESHKTIEEMARKIKCRPRETIVNIKYTGRKVIPSKITTKLCSGFCSGSKSCMSVESKNVSLAVSISDSNNRLQCSVVSVTRDIKCKCDCDKKLLECSSKQTFDKRFCKCKCNNEEEYRSCVNKMGTDLNKFYWDNNECFCKCKNEYVCSTGSRWNHNHCRCVRPKKRKAA